MNLNRFSQKLKQLSIIKKLLFAADVTKKEINPFHLLKRFNELRTDDYMVLRTEFNEVSSNTILKHSGFWWNIIFENIYLSILKTVFFFEKYN